MKTINLIFIGDEFYSQSGTMMSCLYQEENWFRYDWGFVAGELRNGNIVNIRPATDAELGKAHRMLNECVATKRNEK
jgi:hypothetical protein